MSHQQGQVTDSKHIPRELFVQKAVQVVEDRKMGEVGWGRKGQAAQDRLEGNWPHDREQEGPSLVVEAM